MLESRTVMEIRPVMEIRSVTRLGKGRKNEISRRFETISPLR